MVKANFLNRGTEDPKWQGPQRHFFTVFAIKNLFLIVFAILIVVESVLFREWTRGYDSNNAAFWARNSIPILVDSFLTLVTSWCIATQKWHPIAALVTSIFWPGVWVFGATYNSVGPYSTEVYFPRDDQWWALCWAEAAIQCIIGILYYVMMGFAAKAVHEMRKAEIRRAVDVELSARRVSERLSWDDAPGKV
ncbi:hypothetical protein CC80DRAFT_590124 [Byssothecium circinans]|uniref:MARVEL domain-containing protein n=1 Tax=Byssothecium circinans TaxID=147558 RepID=A0A6A5U6L4_9PLEO|nr:hypothetical protein CC80DRAFT_590124 [Byssothecium circinans]